MATLWHDVWCVRNMTLFEGKFFFLKAIQNFEITVEEFMTSKVSLNVVGDFGSSSRSELLQEGLPKGFIKVNVDVVWKDLEVALSILVKDNSRSLLFLHTKLFFHSSPYLAELKVLIQASEYAFEVGWDNAYWECDVRQVTKDVLFVTKPNRWDSSGDILAIRRILKLRNQSLS